MIYHSIRNDRESRHGNGPLRSGRRKAVDGQKVRIYSSINTLEMCMVFYSRLSGVTQPEEEAAALTGLTMALPEDPLDGG
jgi:hypothetical protein